MWLQHVLVGYCICRRPEPYRGGIFSGPPFRQRPLHGRWHAGPDAPSSRATVNGCGAQVRVCAFVVGSLLNSSLVLMPRLYLHVLFRSAGAVPSQEPAAAGICWLKWGSGAAFVVPDRICTC